MYTNVNEDHSSGTSSGQTGMKKGPWSAAEDAVLMDYVKRNGEGNWNAVQRITGLMRCGKSCRLRWANHLRPNLKKGGFSPEEERIILDLHSKIGNKWARMASRLPGRTDNEIKNFWNTRLKRRQRAGLPLHAQGYQEGATTFNHSNQEDDQQINCQHNYSSPNPCLSSIFTPCHPQFNCTNLSSFATSEFPLMQNIQLGSFGDDHTINGGNLNGLALPISTSLVSPYSGPSPSSSSTSMYHQNFEFQATITPPLTRLVDHETNDDELEDNHTSFKSIIMGSDHVEPFGSLDVPEIELELPSNQNYFMSYPMNAASFSTTSARGFENSSGDVNYNEGGENCETGFSEGRRINSGLLDDLLVEAKRLSSRKLVNPIINPDYECSKSQLVKGNV